MSLVPLMCLWRIGKFIGPPHILLPKHINSTSLTHLKEWKSLISKPIPQLLSVPPTQLLPLTIGTNSDGFISFAFTKLGPSYVPTKGEAFVALHAVKSA